MIFKSFRFFEYLLSYHNVYKLSEYYTFMAKEDLEYFAETHEFTAVDPTREIKAIIEEQSNYCTEEVLVSQYVSRKYATNN